MNLPDYLLASDTQYRLVKRGIQLYQFGDDFQILGEARACASGGCPAVMVLQDAPDTIFTKDWQFAVYAWNIEMPRNAIIALMGDSKAMFNNTGFGSDNHFNNYLTGNIGYEKDPRYDKLRTFALNTHSGWDDGIYVYVHCMNGNNPPAMKSGKLRPRTIAEVNPDDYLYHPRTHPELFLDCSNAQWKTEPKRLAYGPFDNGVRRDWMSDNEIHSFMPLVSKFSVIKTPKKNWNKLPLGSKFPSAFRRS